MKVLFDSTVLFHIERHSQKMKQIISEKGISDYFITRINYLEILSGASDNAKLATRKFLHPYKLLELDRKAIGIANNLSMKYRISKNRISDFLIASIAIANNLPLLTENQKDFPFKEIKLLPYRINFI